MTNNFASFDQKFSSPFMLQKHKAGFAVPRHIFLNRLSSSFQRYDALESFRGQIEESKAGIHHQPYTNSKKSVATYRIIFLANSLLFIILAIFAFSLPSTIHTGLFLGTLTTVKSVVVGICAMLSIASLTIGILMHAEREAVYQTVQRAKKKLARSYQRKLLSLGFKRHLLFGKKRLHIKALKEMYNEKQDQIFDKKEEALHLVHRIATASTLESLEKESLLNQAIEELNDNLANLNFSFKNASIPHFIN